MVDYIVVGAGSAGCVVAARLSEDPSVSVLLLEAGKPDKKQDIHIPAAFSNLFHTEYDWDYRTVPQAELDNRELYWPRGKVLGGSSSINAMMWVRGVPADYDAWAKAGNAGWSYDELLPYFKRSEDTERHDPHHTGKGGPITVEEPRDPNPAVQMFVDACVQAGIPRNSNANVGTNEGVDVTQVSQHRGRRMSTAAGYIKPALGRPNLTVETEAHVTRVIIENGRAVGVTYVVGSELRMARCEREVVLSGGAVNSPQLLMLSGIGDADHLRSVGIEPIADLPGVGSNLSDHLASGVIMTSTRKDTLVAAETPRQIADYLVRRKGLLTSNVGEAFAFVKSSDDLEGPDIELIFAPVPFLDHGDTEPWDHGYTIGVILLQPKSRGTIRLASDDPLQAPLIDPAYLTAGDDLDISIWGVKKAFEVFATRPLADIVSQPMRPERMPESDADIEAAIRRYGETLYHPVGTCAMGVDDDGVVDPELRVKGVAGLRVADASVMPTINRGHTNAPAIMIGEKAAELLRGWGS